MPPSRYCLRCNRALSNKVSIKHGYGPLCWARVRKVMRLEQSQAPDPVTITNQMTAMWSRRELLRRLLTKAQVKTCQCGTPLEKCEFITCDHGEGGLPLKGYGVPQWVWFECPTCGYQYAWWKLRPPALTDLFSESRDPTLQEISPLPTAKEGGQVRLSRWDIPPCIEVV